MASSPRRGSGDHQRSPGPRLGDIHRWVVAAEVGVLRDHTTSSRLQELLAITQNYSATPKPPVPRRTPREYSNSTRTAQFIHLQRLFMKLRATGLSRQPTASMESHLALTRARLISSNFASVKSSFHVTLMTPQP